MSYVVIARRYRPQQFADVVGQEHITQTLSNAIANGRIGQAYIFSGPRGVGKTTTARILAMALNYEKGPTPIPDIESPICQAIIKGKSMDVMEIDGASNRRIEEIRNLRENINYTPSEGRYRIYIIDEVHMLTNEAFNALLKTLEEPPAHAVFVFATTEIHRVPATILSRCQRFDFKRIPINTLVAHLKAICASEKIEIDDEAVMQIAKKADGSMRDSQSILDQIISFGGQKIGIKEVEQSIGVINQDIFFKLADHIREQKLKEILLLARDLFSTGVDLTELMLGLEEHFRNILVAASMKSTELLDVSESYGEKYLEQTGRFTENDVIAYLNIISSTMAEMKWVQQPFLKFELALVKMAKMPASKNIEELLEKISGLKKKALNPEPVTPHTPKQPDSALASNAKALTLQTISTQWPQIMASLKKEKPTVAGLLEKAEIAEFANMQLNLKLTCNTFEKNLIEKGEPILATVLEQHFAQKITTKLNLSIASTASTPAVTPVSAKKQQKNEKIEDLKKSDPLFKRYVEELNLEPYN